MPSPKDVSLMHDLLDLSCHKLGLRLGFCLLSPFSLCLRSPFNLLRPFRLRNQILDDLGLGRGRSLDILDGLGLERGRSLVDLLSTALKVSQDLLVLLVGGRLVLLSYKGTSVVGKGVL